MTLEAALAIFRTMPNGALRRESWYSDHRITRRGDSDETELRLWSSDDDRITLDYADLLADDWIAIDLDAKPLG